MKDVLKPGTSKNYTTTERYLKDYLKKEVRTSNTYLKDLSYSFVIDFEKYLRRKKDENGKLQLTNNGAMKHMERFKKLLNLAIKLKWMIKNPFQDYKMKFKKFDWAFLSTLELQKLEETIFKYHLGKDEEHLLICLLYRFILC